ncbi:AraC family transcriptional regulator [Rhizobium leguminosarum]|uniref:helix-turn-helix domain-containing protein n=1 Tax=Rhizobium TaxID=379 RepID=UPI00103030AD|nr:helix-turn-helix transcriptional regulator [Rhizobium leguminosarum]TBF87422.1 AraC family transcriptional regulator [Rhizobium leguminosarum]TBG07037.1 AraC family transcriptional regulator [Rhizobium leguminosarum]TBG07813.1 AraC family transcriptional regulator [Rhizobium leguminosarum]TBG30728.1 AraC family transcriptional regulator [Rhizobium leguminosarum]TBG50112.1 AraC family transcriptional regulator [Rhizobium leguminosarum]
MTTTSTTRVEAEPQRYTLVEDPIGWTVWDHANSTPAILGEQILSVLPRRSACLVVELLNAVDEAVTPQASSLTPAPAIRRYILPFEVADQPSILPPSVLIVAQGGLSISFADRQYVCKKGKCFATLIDLPCVLRSTTQTEAHFIVLPIGDDDLATSRACHWRDPQPLLWASSTISPVLEAIGAKHDSSIDRVSVLNAVWRASPLAAISAAAAPKSRTSTIKRACRKIYGRRDQSNPIAGLAEEAMMSPSSFAHHFTRTVGMSPGAYRKKARMFDAGIALSCQNDTVSVIAKQVGYNSLRQFYTDFQAIWSTTPAEFRRAGLNVSTFV